MNTPREQPGLLKAKVQSFRRGLIPWQKARDLFNLFSDKWQLGYLAPNFQFMVKTLGIGDLLATALLLALAFRLDIPIDMLIFVSICLFLKALICLFDIGGMIDITVVILLILSIFITLPSWILLVVAALIGQKGIMSLLA